MMGLVHAEYFAVDRIDPWNSPDLCRFMRHQDYLSKLSSSAINGLMIDFQDRRREKVVSELGANAMRLV